MHHLEIPLSDPLSEKQAFYDEVSFGKADPVMKPAKKQELLSVLSELLENRVFPWCTEFSTDCVTRVLYGVYPPSAGFRFIYRVSPLFHWIGMFIIQEKTEQGYQDLFSTTAGGSRRLTEYCQENVAQTFIQEYIFRELAQIFDLYYRQEGRFYPAVLQLVPAISL
ncbi:hypothetical protein Sgly_1519 [Syntrophobotulus glycolicus DSM 8271]|uniref:Uncharacterized protein n=1 Tax=Syntrophobotulus glycolicus (strain DSM 8271 / FlGlyR) TaxID=645991 RepID=F0SX37_SYNGF|nr:hypothetical protein [Syntrophobotulus glycolicus]ADY55820.1 hypothetical protein Sgly_1519 [Syntrophobotulus glycolicus DSM 8271]